MMTAPGSRFPPGFDDGSEHLACIEAAAASVTEALGAVPNLLIVAGSGLGLLANRLERVRSAKYEDLAHFPASTVQGHGGRLMTGLLADRPVVLMSGRRHLYEGGDPRHSILPIRALIRCGIRTVFLSNAAGSVSSRFLPGDLMLIRDHVNLQFRNPLAGPQPGGTGTRFPDMSDPYDAELRRLARRTALEDGIGLEEGTYVGLLGPSYETAAEVRFLRLLGDAVGMSTVPETLAAREAGVRVLGISAITNSHVHGAGAPTTHEEVLETGARVAERFARLATKIAKEIS